MNVCGNASVGSKIIIILITRLLRSCCCFLGGWVGLGGEGDLLDFLDSPGGGGGNYQFLHVCVCV